MFVISFCSRYKDVVNINCCLTRFYNRSELMVTRGPLVAQSAVPVDTTISQVRTCPSVSVRIPFSLIRDSG